MKNIITNFLIVAALIVGSSTLNYAAAVGETNLINAEINSSTTILNSMFRVLGNKTKWHKIYMTQDTLIDVELDGNGRTNLDLYIYDADLKLVSSKAGSTDYEFAELEIYEDGYFWVAVVNRGRRVNDYVLTIDEY